MTTSFPNEDYVLFSPGEQILAGLWNPTISPQTIVRGNGWTVYAVYKVKADGTKDIFYDAYHNDPVQQQPILDALKSDLDAFLAELKTDEVFYICLGLQDGWSTEVRPNHPLVFKRSSTFRQPVQPPSTPFVLEGQGTFLDLATEPPIWSSNSLVKIELLASTITNCYGRVGSEQQDLFIGLSTGKLVRLVLHTYLSETLQSVYLYDGPSEFAQPIASLSISNFQRDDLIDFLDKSTRSLEVV